MLICWQGAVVYYPFPSCAPERDVFSVCDSFFNTFSSVCELSKIYRIKKELYHIYELLHL